MSIFKDKRGDLCFGDCTIFGRNFDGNKFGRGGAKGFCLKIDEPAWVDQLVQEGWNVKETKPQDPDAEPMYYIPVAINYNDRFSPNIYIYSGHRRVRLNDDTVGELNSADIEKVDAIVHPRTITDDKTGNTRVKAYIKTLHVVLEEDPFSDEFANYDIGDSESDDSVPFDL